MRFSEILSEAVHDPKIDWNKFKLALAAYAASRGLSDYGRIDGIIFLGLAGDPNSQSILDVRLKGPARIGVADPESGKDLGFVHPDKRSRTAGEYYGFSYSDKDEPDPARRERGYQIRKQYEYQIIINHEYFDQATGNFDTGTLAHEAMHRGFDIIRSVPDIRNNISSRTQKYIDELKTEGQKIPGLGLENTGNRDFLEHLIIYSVTVPDQIGPNDLLRSKEEVKLFQMMYNDINKAAVAYIKRYPTPNGSLEILRREVDRMTPGDIRINVVPDASGRPIIVGFLDKVVDAVKQGASSAVNAVKQGANKVVDKIKSALDIGTTPAQPPSNRNPQEVSWYASLLDRIKRNAGLSSKKYVIKTGDTLRKVAQQNNTNIDALLKANPQIKNPDSIFVGDEIIIP